METKFFGLPFLTFLTFIYALYISYVSINRPRSLLKINPLQGNCTWLRQRLSLFSKRSMVGQKFIDPEDSGILELAFFRRLGGGRCIRSIPQPPRPSVAPQKDSFPPVDQLLSADVLKPNMPWPALLHQLPAFRTQHSIISAATA